MKEYRFEEISLGLSESFEVEITREMMDKFQDISGDVNPLHNDTEFAKSETRIIFWFDDKDIDYINEKVLDTISNMLQGGHPKVA